MFTPNNYFVYTKFWWFTHDYMHPLLQKYPSDYWAPMYTRFSKSNFLLLSALLPLKQSGGDFLGFFSSLQAEKSEKRIQEIAAAFGG
jgi:hypothetical protein